MLIGIKNLMSVKLAFSTERLGGLRGKWSQVASSPFGGFSMVFVPRESQLCPLNTDQNNYHSIILSEEFDYVSSLNQGAQEMKETCGLNPK